MERSIVTGKERRNQGFTLLELMIAMFIVIILLSVALPTYQRSVQYAKETVLKENLWQMRKAIDQYASDKGKYPPSLESLIARRGSRQCERSRRPGVASRWCG